MFSSATRKRGHVAWFAFLFLCMCAVAASSPAGKDLLPENPVVLNVFWRVSFGRDYGETTDHAEMMRKSPSGIMYYVPAAPNDPQGAQTQPVYRLFTPHIPDHMSSIKKGEGGYNTEGILGYAWVRPNAHPGLSPIQRVYNDLAGSPHYRDHALVVGQTTTPEAKAKDDLLNAGYHPETPLGYAYARYPSTTKDQFLVKVSGAGITVASNAVVGCTIYEWTWSGIQFINDFDYGRQISSAFGAIGGPGGQTNNPTENGDKYGGGPSPEDDGTKHGTPLLLRHGSPCLSITTNGNVQSTRAIPLEWDPDKFGGGRDHPVIYPDVQLGKNLTLGWSKDGVTRPIALYQTVLSSPTTMDRVQIEVPSAYLLARFNNYYIYFPAEGIHRVHNCINRASQTSERLIQIPGSSPCFSNGKYKVDGIDPGPTAVIMSSGTSPTSPAMAIYANSPKASVVIYNRSQGPDQDQYGNNSVKGSIVYSGTIPATPPDHPWTFNSWIITDTLANVEKDIDLLYSWGVTSQ
jgi:hypothetical protein